MGHKCFISFKTEDAAFKRYIQTELKIDMIDNSLNKKIDSEDSDYVLAKIRSDYLADATVTIHLIGSHSAENLGPAEQEYIKRELQASLYNGEGNSRNGILGVVLPAVENIVYRGDITCSQCGNTHRVVAIDDSTVVKEFSYNYYVPNGKCSYPDADRYCVLVKWDDFCKTPEVYIEEAFNKRSAPIASKVKVYP